MQEKKLAWVENIRGIAILAVVLGHISNPTQAFIFTWHMPLFFLISGFFLDHKKSDIDFIFLVFKRLIPAYFIAMLIGFNAEYLKNILLDRPQIQILTKIFTATVSMDFDALKNSYGFVLWFLPALFWARVILFYLKKYVKSAIFVWMLGILIFLLSMEVALPLGLDEGFFVLIFVITGNYFFNILHILRRRSLLILLLILLSIYGFLYFFSGFSNVDVAVKRIDPLFIGIFQSFSLCLIIVLMSFLVPLQIKLLQKISSMSFTIFILHPYTNNVAHLIVFEFLQDYWVCKFLLSIIFIYILKISLIDRVVQRFAQ